MPAVSTVLKIFLLFCFVSPSPGNDVFFARKYSPLSQIRPCSHPLSLSPCGALKGPASINQKFAAYALNIRYRSKLGINVVRPRP
ncbi:hypothetical protein V8C43DRAFT_75915 [Trichoderma afarasin]